MLATEHFKKERKGKEPLNELHFSLECYAKWYFEGKGITPPHYTYLKPHNTGFFSPYCVR